MEDNLHEVVRAIADRVRWDSEAQRHEINARLDALQGIAPAHPPTDDELRARVTLGGEPALLAAAELARRASATPAPVG